MFWGIDDGFYTTDSGYVQLDKHWFRGLVVVEMKKMHDMHNGMEQCIEYSGTRPKISGPGLKIVTRFRCFCSVDNRYYVNLQRIVHDMTSQRTPTLREEIFRVPMVP